VNPYAGAVRAPDFPAGLDWINSEPLSMADLHGRYVVLDFWTAGCINCIHELPHLERLQRTYPYELVVIGVQSAKYPAEGDRENLEDAVHRYGIEHPVVNDPEYTVWNAYAVNAWPTLVFVSPDGKVIGSHAGEVPFEALDRVIHGLIVEGWEASPLDTTTPSFEPRHWERPVDRLAFPGKVLVAGGKLFVADSGHNRILISGLEGALQVVVGGPDPGNVDGAFADARFHAPQGMALDDSGTVLYVADSGNHTVRALDLGAQTATTVAGTGTQTMRFLRGGAALETALSSPWDVQVRGRQLLVAMAGLHQIWSIELDSGVSRVWAGTGHEGLKDGTRAAAWFAQPTGLSLTDERLLVACAEAQAIRSIDMASGEVTTLAGEGLFDFGDDDGHPATARLQHCQGVASDGVAVYVADTYNNKIRAIDLHSGTVRTVAGSGQRGLLDGPATHARFTQPAGLSIAGRTLFIADTGNHTVRTLDLDDGHARTLTISGLAQAVHL
jgi:DNA-binding beta-propeller fold protein YncE